MRESLVPLLRCPRCRNERELALRIDAHDAREVRTGGLACARCGQDYAIRDGIVDLLHDPPEFVRREAAGLGRFAEMMRADGWDRERILGLPDTGRDGYWYVQAASLLQLCREIPFKPGDRILDVGSNTCWASNRFAEMGLDVVALDIATAEMQGLRTADWFLESRGTYFERVLGVMFDPPFASGTFDYVLCCEVLHHNDKRNLRRTFSELHRLLKPGGSLLVLNEPMKFLMDLKRDHAVEVAEYEGHEHVFFFHQYYLAARHAGFQLSIRPPAYVSFFQGIPLTGHNAFVAMKARVLTLARRHRLSRHLYLAYRNIVRGNVALNLICRKSI